MPSNDAPHTILRELTSSLTAYHDLVQEILKTLAELGWQEGELFGVHMALEESISNAIRHGNKEDPAKLVRVECRLSQNQFWAKVCDEGDGYNPDAVPDCCSPENLEVPGGRGLALIRAYMDSVEHSECGKCLTMEKLRPAASDC
ncbi:MAG: ATP-binding protein [Planctomycetales bacterium]|nr:ATP-binding protein [Planctomycetales bacterium]